ncbi:pimeloyl-ACP methyl ester esterase BioH [Beggiatoa leptomitoformis]|uniref:Pimeloyl-[acyl-carrier protein] methyl ester esterase n=1 Tax=Beggiatoa leptomitoformis TaxID=288004 RepID=A0A2N9YC37_9GAMM|nr:pimeloyl-ACP methyl ester esterase BioH [Beggiatoa leptomitoformis]ALG66659.1 pimeloyl-ACP methyl ester esterase BioH [Beggiatoa leptomitoformis]AUI68021.1 pimeloyl-ACP methyl ester esterase BioH [Beggiatoa leptomitoformis]
MHINPLYIKQQGQGNPLILLHGWGFNHTIWDSIANELAKTWRVYLVDLPGHGQSPLCDYELTTLCQILVDNLPQQAVWVGWSLGGLFSMAIANRYPTAVKALALVATSPRFSIADDWKCAMTNTILQTFEQNLQADAVGTLKRFLSLQVKNSDTARTQLRHLYQLFQTGGYPQPAALQGGLQLLRTVDLRDTLAQITCPAWLCLGEHDTLVPVAVGEACQQIWRPLETVYIPSAAHIPFLSHPELFLHHLSDFFSHHGLT